MKLKELMPFFAFALATTFALQYFFSPKKQTTDTPDNPKSGQHFTAPRTTELSLLKPLNTEVDFIDRTIKKPIISTFETQWGRYEFSSNGASIERLEFRRNWGGKEGYLSTLFPPMEENREQKAMLVALREKTPYSFEIDQQTDEKDYYSITYKADFEDGILTKNFVIFKDKCQLDLTITIEPKNGKSIQPRVLFPAPFVAELGDKDTITGIVNDEKNNVQVLQKNEQLLTEYWVKPTLFGAQDRYFIHAMVNDLHNFVQRGYFTIKNFESLITFLEGPEITEKTMWTLHFYVGPKEDDLLLQVDPRLEQTLNYGWLAFVSRPVSKILLAIINFLYGFLGNYGLAIILLTILMRLLMVPFTFKMEQSRQQQLEFQKKLKHVETKYKDDKQALAAARAELIKKYGMPGLGGCLPLLLQIPLMVALSWVLSNSIELYMAPFLWIKDLSAPDPYYILPVLIGLGMLLYSPVSDGQKISSIAIALVFAAFTSSLSAGLALYILVTTVLGGLQNYFMTGCLKKTLI